MVVLDWNKTAIDFYKKSGAIVDGLEQWKLLEWTNKSLKNIFQHNSLLIKSKKKSFIWSRTSIN